MRLVPLASITIPPRQRKKREAAHIRELSDSIAKLGLLQPSGGAMVGDKFLLSWGESRYLACTELHKANKPFYHDGVLVPKDHVPFTVLQDELTEADRFEAELDENIKRRDLHWTEKTQAIADLHNMRLSQNPKQTFLATGAEIAASTGQNPDYVRAVVKDSVLVAEHMANPKIAGARNANEARQLILKQEEERINAAIARRFIAATPEKPKIEIRNGSMLEILPTLDSDFVDLICFDPPYGISAGAAGFRSRTVHHHNYEDTPELARQILDCALTEGFRICKSRANFFSFGSIDNWEYFKQSSARLGWVPFPRPLIWGKSDSEGLAPWGAQGPRITTEFFFYATKGRKGLIASPTDYFRENRVSRSERIHAAEKPVELMRKIIECSTLPDDFVLDPCCGSGSTLVAAREINRRGLGIEIDKDYYATALANVYKEDIKA